MNSLNVSTANAIEAFGIEPLSLGEPASQAEVRAELQRIITSRQFDASDRNRRFLAYVVEETLAGRGERIKAYNIATLVFGRDENFDPQLDPVVRMEARRLRRSLERFYLVEGTGCALRIAVPKGSYVPEFQDALGDGTGALDIPGSWREHPFQAVSVVVTPFEVEDDGRRYRNHSEALCLQIAVGLSRSGDVEIYTHPVAVGDASQRLQRNFAGLCLVLEGNAVLSENALKVTVALVGEGRGKVVWGDVFEEGLVEKGAISARERVATRIVDAVGGVLERMTQKHRLPGRTPVPAVSAMRV